MKVFKLKPHSSWQDTPLNSGAYRTWLLERGSLTRRLQTASASFSVEPLLSSGRVMRDEASLLQLHPKQKALVREVFLCCNEKPAVFAHSILPYRSLRGAWRALADIGSTPLGAALFSDPKVGRTPLEYKRLTVNHPLYKVARKHLGSTAEGLWARRSIFKLGDASILVTEVFLPQVLTL
jgi:chorismate--pyruvate lyase